jgi:hypothetical protein
MMGASYPKFARKNLDLKLINKAPLKHAHDDEVGHLALHLPSGLLKLTLMRQWRFNSQCSSQWDGFRHYAYQSEAVSPQHPSVSQG